MLDRTNPVRGLVIKSGFFAGLMALSETIAKPSCGSHKKSPNKKARRNDAKRIEAKKLAKVLLAGQFQNGKSTLINCLLGGTYAIEGDGRHTTAYQTIYRYSEQGPKYYRLANGGTRELSAEGLEGTVERDGMGAIFEAEVPAKVLENFVLVDAPGWGAEDSDDKQAERSLEGVDFVIYLAQPKELSQDDKNFLRLLKKTRTYFCMVLNARDATDPTDATLQNVAGAISGAIKQLELEDQFIRFPSPSGLCVVNLLWAKYGRHMLDRTSDGRESGQAMVVAHVFGLTGVDSHDLVLRESGFSGLCDFLHGAVTSIRRFGTPLGVSLYEEVSDDICSAILRIVGKGK